MIGLVLGTSEGKEILSILNKFTDDIFISTATSYGGELLKNYKYKVLNTKPLDKNNFVDVINKNHINIFVDVSHPYAVEVSKNIMDACKECSVEYYRFERTSQLNKYGKYEKLVKVKNYFELEKNLKTIKGTILDTTGSKNINKILEMNLNNRVVHRILPSVSVIKKCIDLGIKIENLIALKGPISYQLNRAFIKEYSVKALIIKDSGEAGGSYEKIKSAIDEDIYVFVLEREEIYYKNIFFNIDEIINSLLEFLKK